MNQQEELSRLKRVRRAIIGAPRDVTDPKIFHSLSLVAFLAWVGLGADDCPPRHTGLRKHTKPWELTRTCR